AFQNGRHVEATARFKKGCHISLPILAVEVHRQKETSLVLHHGIVTDDKIHAPIILPRKMPVDYFISDLEKSAVGTVGTFDSRLLTDSPNPFIGASRRITGFPSFPALETSGINILSAPEKRSEQFYLG